MKLVQFELFRREIAEFPLETREDIFSLIFRFMNGERLSIKSYKIFKIDKNTKIMEFKVKDNLGNWRAIGTTMQGDHLVLIYAFHKKTQKLQTKDKTIIRNRILRVLP